MEGSMKKNYDDVILAENVVFTTDCKKTNLNNNVLVVGTSGCGKTMSIIEPRLLELKNSSALVTVTKRRIVERYRQLMLQRDYQVLEIDFTNPKNCNVGYDPLTFVHNCQDISFLAHAIVTANHKNPNNSIDPYWEEAASSLLSAEIAYVKAESKDSNFNDVLAVHEIIEISSERNGSALMKRIEKLPESEYKDYAFSCLKTIYSLPERTASCIYSTLNVSLDKIFSDEIREIIELENQVDFKMIASNKVVLFLTTSPINTVLNSYINTFYVNAFKNLFEFAESRDDGRLPNTVSILCDDFATGAPIENFPEYISIMREHGISVTLLLQSESQLCSLYGEYDATTIINNFDTYIYMGGMDTRTAMNVSQRINKPLEDVLYMPLNKVVIFRRGQKPIMSERYHVTENKEYQELMEMKKSSRER